MLLFLYTSDYNLDRNTTSALCKIMSQSTMTVVASDTFEKVSEVVLAAQMYGLAEKYAISKLKHLSSTRYQELIEEASVANLLALVDIVYESTPASDNMMRKWLVWQIQVRKKSCNESNSLVELVQKHEDFAQDLITKYAARNYVWCPDCLRYIDLVYCRCGWSGMCGNPGCTAGAIEKSLRNLNCTNCRTVGRLQYDKTG